MSTASLLERLAAHRTLDKAPQHEIEWIANHGALRVLEPGGILTSRKEPVEGLHIVLDGYLTIHVDQGAGRRKIMEWRGGDVTGLLPYSRLQSPPGDVVAEERTEIVTVYRKDLPEMTRECNEVTARLVHAMLDRARLFNSSQLQDEKLLSLGKIAAGLAHELNNPAAAISRSAGELRTNLTDFAEASRALGSLGLSEGQIVSLQNVRDGCMASGVQSVLSPLQQEDREDAIAKWLKEHKSQDVPAEALAETDVTFDMLNDLARSLEGPALHAALLWLAASCTTRRLTLEIQQASSRICELVGAIKGFTQMDRASVPEPVDIRQGLTNTLAVLGSKAKGKSVGVSMDIAPDVPRVNGFAGELNQVWANLIDNALDAVAEGGQVEVVVRREREGIVVRVIDNGPGVPADVRSRVFDPFFTTKPAGKGTGLGLDIVRRLVQRHNGQVDLESRPGRTEFRVTLPVLGAT